MDKWIVRGGKAEEFSRELGVGKLCAKILSSRMSLEEAKAFLSPDAPLPDPFLLPDMEKAVELIGRHIGNNSKIRIVGDYDVDGISSSSILTLGLREIGATVDYIIPERIGEGYGFSEQMAVNCVKDQVSLVITCDTGIRELERACFLAENHIDLIVTDHHEIEMASDESGGKKEVLPYAYAVINARREASRFPSKEICGAYTAYLLIEALSATYPLSFELKQRLLSYAAMATVCDVMPLTGENRKIVIKGLKILNENPSVGIRALKNVSGLKKIDAHKLGFVIGPMLNAGGRLSSQNIYARILISDDEAECAEFARELSELNRERHDLTERGLKEAEKQADQDSLPVKVIYLPDTHESVAGLIAGKLKEKLNRPVFIVTKGESGLKGSGRSIETYSMFERMCDVSEVFSKFGGHPMAAGFSLNSESGHEQETVDRLRQKLNENHRLTTEDLDRKVMIDAVIPVKDFTLYDLETLSVLEPYGTGNPKPVFAQKGLELVAIRFMGSNGKTIRMTLKSAGAFTEAVAFKDYILKDAIDSEDYLLLSQGKKTPNPVMIDICYQAEINEYRGRKSVSVSVIHIRKSNM